MSEELGHASDLTFENLKRRKGVADEKSMFAVRYKLNILKTTVKIMILIE